jgi:dCTP deaminase
LEAPFPARKPGENVMGALPDCWIKEMAKHRQMIVPFANSRRRKGRISSGTSSYGYDFRLSNEYRLPQFEDLKCMDPKKMDQIRFRDHKGASCIIPPNGFVLGRSLEYFRIPRDVLVICQGKSTYARSGILVNVTPLEPEWEGYITIAIMNGSPVPAKIYSGEGIGQAIFIRAETPCEISYQDRKGKYQAQKGITLAGV